ncbi:MAG TPA: Na+/H+ antiporter NhaA, partial [Euzebyales bacterium]|nr:Na+/H+ antiporter NhaA [Euzebyales bacterium]
MADHPHDKRAPQPPLFRLPSWGEAKFLAEALRAETVGGVLLLLGAVLALVWASTPWTDTYEQVRRFVPWPDGEALHLDLDLAHWAGDGLSAIFFFVVGLELKREFVAGELRSPRQAALPIVAAIGGIAVPPLIFVLFNLGDSAALRGRQDHRRRRLSHHRHLAAIVLGRRNKVYRAPARTRQPRLRRRRCSRHPPNLTTRPRFDEHAIRAPSAPSEELPTVSTATNRPAPVLQPGPHLFDADGPFVSVYLTTRGALPDAAEQVALRWRNLRRQLADDGAPEAALAAVDPLTDGAHREGESLVVVAHAGGVLYSAHLPQAPQDDVAVLGDLPRLTPLLAATQRLIPHIVVVTDRLGAELIVVQPDDADHHTAVDGEELHVTRSAPGGWSQPRFQQRAENRWDANAREVADALTRLVDAHHPKLVVVSGDVRAVQFLRAQLPPRVADLLAEVQGDYSDLEEALLRTDDLVAARAEAETAETLQALEREQGQGDLAATGAEATLHALARGQVDTVLLDP